MTRKRFYWIAIGLMLLVLFTSSAFAQGPKPRGIQPPHEPYCETPCEITGQQLQQLVNLALSQPGVSQAREDLEDLDYSRKPQYDYGERQDTAEVTTKAISIASE